MKKIMKYFFLPIFVISSVTLVGCDKNKGNADSLMISEIVHGSERTNIAIELYNNTKTEISLEEYSLNIQFSERLVSKISLSGVLESQKTFVLVHEQATSEVLKQKADTFVFIGEKNGDYIYNGKQPIMLKNDVEDREVDGVGLWGYNDIEYANNRTLARKKEYLYARPNFDEYDWIRYNVDEFSYLGTIDVSVTEAQLLAGPKLEDKDVEAPFSKEDGRGGYIGGGGLMGATVRAYIDGDTTRFNYSDTAELEKLGISQGEKVRYQNIDTPESYVGNIQRFGLVAKQYTHDILASAKSIYVQTTKDGSITETFGRILGWVWADGKLVNFEVVKRGYSEVAFGSNDTMVYRGVSYTSYLYNAMLYAKSQLLGVHADPDGKYGEIDPYWDYDKNQVKDEYSNGNPK